MTTPIVPVRFSHPARVVLHPTDFSPASELAFAHALRLALMNKARLSILHVGQNILEDWDRFPRVRELLQRWRLLDAGAHRSDVFSKLGVEIEKVIVRKNNVVASIAEYGITHPIDLLVVATEQRHGVARWFHPSTAERTARKLAVPTLFVPAGDQGCVSSDDGRVTMDRVLIPVDHQPPAGEAIERGLRVIAAYGRNQSKLTLLHVGPEAEFPTVKAPSGSWQVERVVRQGNPVTEILAAAEDCAANLLIMVTKGTEGFLDALRGTTTEQVVRHAPCPVLSVPRHD